MRWFVEISSLGKKAGKPPTPTTVCVEATQWQPALQRARALRGEEGPLSNFSIELLDDGYRAIDPAARVRYVVKRAPDDAPLTNGVAAVDKDNGGAKPVAGKAEPGPEAAANGPKPRPSSAPDAQKSQPPEESRRASRTQPFKSTGAAAVREAASTKPGPSTAPPKPTAKAQESVKPPPPRPEPIEVSAKPLISIPLDRPPPPPRKPVPKFQVVAKREEGPTDRSPLHYREYAYAVAEGTAEADAKLLILDRFGEIKRSLVAEKAGKLVNLAVFDHVFKARPERRPLVTLAWKDWKASEPEIRFPAREGGETPTPLAASARSPVSTGPQAAASPGAASAPPSAPRPSAPVPAAEIAHADASQDPTVTVEMAEAVDDFDATKTIPFARSDAPSVDKPRLELVPSITPQADSEAAGPISLGPSGAPNPRALGPIEVTVVADDVDSSDQNHSPSYPRASTLPLTNTVPPDPPRPKVEAPPPPKVQARKKQKRLKGDDLLAELFEAFGELHFLPDSLAGAGFVLSLVLDKIPSEVGVVSFFDINKREFVVVRQLGGPRSALCFRQPEKAPIALSAMRKKQAIVVSDTADVERAMDDRWRAIGIELRSLVCAPIALGGRYLGLIEVANPTDETLFTAGDGHALSYIGEQFGEFVAERGLVIDTDQILESAKAASEKKQ